MPEKNPLKLASDALSKAIDSEKRSKKFMESIGPAIIQALSPVLSRIENAVSNLKVEIQPNINISPEVRIPEIKIPDIRVPDIEVPTPIVNYTPPKIIIPDIKMPDEMNITGWVRMMGYDREMLSDPLPVQIRDAEGNPIDFGTGVSSGGSGGFRHIVVDKLPSTIPANDGNATIGDGSQTVTTAGTRVQLSTSSVPCKKVNIQAKVANTGSIYVGGSTVSSTRGIELLPLSSIQMTPSDLNLVYLDSSVSGEGVIFIYEN